MLGWGGGLVCLLQSLLSLRETDTCTKRHFFFFLKQRFCSKIKSGPSASRFL